MKTTPKPSATKKSNGEDVGPLPDPLLPELLADAADEVVEDPDDIALRVVRDAMLVMLEMLDALLVMMDDVNDDEDMMNESVEGCQSVRSRCRSVVPAVWRLAARGVSRLWRSCWRGTGS